MGNAIAALFLLLVAGGILHSCQQDFAKRDSAASAAAVQARDAQATAAKASETAARCRADPDAPLNAYRQLMASKKYLDARAAVSDCLAATNDSRLQALSDAAYTADLRETATEARFTTAQRLNALDRLQTISPATFVPLAPTYAALQKAQAREIEQARLADLARRRMEGVTIGMSKKDVLLSSWGKPRKVNRTTRASGTTEQWVYDGGYLYFDDDTLTSIQN